MHPSHVNEPPSLEVHSLPAPRLRHFSFHERVEYLSQHFCRHLFLTTDLDRCAQIAVTQIIHRIDAFQKVAVGNSFWQIHAILFDDARPIIQMMQRQSMSIVLSCMESHKNVLNSTDGIYICFPVGNITSCGYIHSLSIPSA